MAVAWCINAYDCSWNLIRTLEQLQSSNIGVWVQYTAPNPLDDKKINYIKYTDKCGCTCTLSWENEILIYSTNWVIKNLSLTNDDTNERVIVKWNDIFGSNWLKTVVRYKTGSAPTSLTDWTLAVEETTKNQYATNGYWVSWLSDDTTYYFSVFGVDTDGTVINVQSKAITTSFFLAKYQRVEYIQSTWSQYIKTSIIPSNSKWIYIKLSNQDAFNNSIFVGSRQWDMRFWISANENMVSYWWNTYYGSGSMYNNTIYEIGMNYLNSRTWTLNWNTQISLWTLSTNTQPVYIFTWNYNWSFLPSKIKLYSLKLSDWTTITHEFVPVYRKSDSVIWMLDIINKVFYTNNGSWTFSKWWNIPR